MKLVITVLGKIHLVIDGGIKRIVMSETAIKQKASAWSIPGVDRSDVPKVYDTALNSFKDEMLLKAITDEFNIGNDELMSGRRFVVTMEPMHLYRYLLKAIKSPVKRRRIGYYRHSLPEAGKITGCDHATVLHSCRTAENLIQTDKSYRAKYEAVLSRLPRYVFNLKKLY